MALAGQLRQSLSGFGGRDCGGPGCIERGMDPGEPVNQDLYEMPASERAERGLALLPQNLGQAAAALAEDSVLSAALGQDFVTEFVRLKRAEWLEYCQQVSTWELSRYLTQF